MAGEKRRKLTKLEQFPCPRWSALREPEGCQPNLAWCGMDGECQYEAVYLRAIADNKCARLLRLLKIYWWDKHYFPDIFTGQSGDRGSVFVAKFRQYMNDVLEGAGLL